MKKETGEKKSQIQYKKKREKRQPNKTIFGLLFFF
jgi:hypothetical protein